MVRFFQPILRNTAVTVATTGIGLTGFYTLKPIFSPSLKQQITHTKTLHEDHANLLFDKSI